MGYCQVVKAQDFDSCIPGSTPGGGFRRVEKWLSRKVHNLETGGSNPPPAIFGT